MNLWVQIWVQREMCWNNTIKLEWYIYDVSIIFPIQCIIKKIVASSLHLDLKNNYELFKCWFGNACTTSKQCKPNWYHRPLPKWARGLILMWGVSGSKPVEEECQNQLCSYCFAHFWWTSTKYWKFLDSVNFEF